MIFSAISAGSARDFGILTRMHKDRSDHEGGVVDRPLREDRMGPGPKRASA